MLLAHLVRPWKLSGTSASEVLAMPAALVTKEQKGSKASRVQPGKAATPYIMEQPTDSSYERAE